MHDLNPTLPPPTGVFWTTPVPRGSVVAHPGNGSATLHVADAHVYDFGDIGHAFLGGPPAPIPATTSFTVQWTGGAERRNVKNRADGHAGEFVFGTARMEWTATAGDYVFRSAPLAESASSFAVVGHERNGIFFPRGA